jgi:hypothetical protein
MIFLTHSRPIHATLVPAYTHTNASNAFDHRCLTHTTDIYPMLLSNPPDTPDDNNAFPPLITHYTQTSPAAPRPHFGSTVHFGLPQRVPPACVAAAAAAVVAAVAAAWTARAAAQRAPPSGDRGPWGHWAPPWGLPPSRLDADGGH